MKKNKPAYYHSARKCLAYPNAASANYFKWRAAQRIMQMLLGIVITILLFFLLGMA